MRVLRIAAVQGLCVLAAIGMANAAAAEGSSTAFGAAARIDDSHTTVGRHAAIGVDSVGNGVAVWQSDGVIYGSRRPVGGTWTAPTALTSTYISGPDVVALREDGTAYFDVGTHAPDGDAIVAWGRNGAVHATGVSGEYADGKVATDLDGDLVAYTESPAGATTYFFAAGGTDPVADGWTSATTVQSFGSSVVAFGAGHTYYVAYPPDRTGTDRRFRVSLVDGRTGAQRLVLRRRLCPPGPHPHLRGYDFAAGRSGAGVLAWRCTGRTVDVVDVQRVSRQQRLGRIVQIARSRARNVTDRLSRPMTAFGAGSPTVLFSRAVSAARRDLLATSPTASGRWRRPSVKADAVAARSAAALTAQLAWSPTGAALVTYRDVGFGGQIWAARRLPGSTFTRPAQLFPWSALVRFGAVAADGSALVVRVAPQRRLAARAAGG